jgi:hypothetical protein
MIDLNERSAAGALNELIGRRIDSALSSLPLARYGVVFGDADLTTRTVAVQLYGQSEPSPGFTFGSLVPIAGDHVRVSIDPRRGDRYISDVLGRSPIDDLVTDFHVGSVNLLTNSSFEYATDWTSGSWTIPYAPVLPERARTGSKTARLVMAGASANAFTKVIPINRTLEYWASWWTWIRSYTSGVLGLFVAQLDAGGTEVRIDRINLAAAETGWTRHSMHFGPDETGGKIAWHPNATQIRIGTGTAGIVSTLTADVDDVQFEQGNALTAYAPQPWELLDLSVGTTKIADDSITSPKIVANAIIAGKVAAGAITVGNAAFVPGNMITDPSFELGLGWSAGQRSQETVVSGAWNGKIGTGQNYLVCEQFVVVGGHRYYAAIWGRGNSGNTANDLMDLRVRWFDIAGAQIGFDVSVDGGLAYGQNNVYRQFRGFVVAPAGAVRAYMFAVQDGAGVNHNSYWDDAEFYDAAMDLSHAGGSVEITKAGVTIRNGLFTLQDEFGSTVMAASGFSGTWSEFIAFGLYNGGFGAGKTVNTDLTAGRTNDLPYWSVTKTNPSGLATYRRQPAAQYASGYAIQYAPGGNADRIVLTSDEAPVVGLRYYTVHAEWGYRVAANSFISLGTQVNWYDANHVLISSSTAPWGDLAADPLAGTYDALAAPVIDLSFLGQAPSNARYARVILTGYQGGTFAATNRIYFGAFFFKPAVSSSAIVDDTFTVSGPGTRLDIQGADFFDITSENAEIYDLLVDSALTLGDSSSRIWQPAAGETRFDTNGFGGFNTIVRVEAAAGRFNFIALWVAGDTQSRAAIRGDSGEQGIEFGAGGVSVRDVRAKRDVAGTLTVDSNGQAVTSALNLVATGGQRNQFQLYVAGDTNSRVFITGDATEQAIYFGPGNVVQDTKLVRIQPGDLWLIGQGAATLARFNVIGPAGTNAWYEASLAGDTNGRMQLQIGGLLFGPGNAALKQVVGPRRTGWTAATGTAQRGTFATDTVTLINLARAVKALEDDLIAHGMIGT